MKTLKMVRETGKRHFVTEKLEAVYAAMQNSISKERSTTLTVFSNLNSHFKQFTVIYDKATAEYHIANSYGNGCSFVLATTYISQYIDVKLYDTQVRYLLKTETHLPYFVYELLEQFDNIEREYLQKTEQLDRLDAASRAIRQWIDDKFSVCGYRYTVTETENHILLSVKIRSVKLSIPVYYRKYEQILEQLIETVKAYENLIAATKIKVYIHS